MKIKLSVLSLFFSIAMLAQDTITSEDILVRNDSIKLPGTLTYSSKLETQPLVIFVHGSGNVDRNGNQSAMGANPNYIKQLNDYLTQKNIAFYRYDKRSATQENIILMMKDMRFEAFVEDLNLIIDKVKNDNRFSSITLIGHSQGSLVAMLADHEHIDKFISLAGPSQPLDRSLVAQVKLQNGDSLAKIVKSHLKELSDTGHIENVDPNLMGLFNKPTQPFIKSWMTYNPSEEIKKLNMPILILNGDKDIQVAVTEAEELHKSNPNSELAIIKNMNHVLKTIKQDSDNIPSYMSSDFPLSLELGSQIELFIKK